MSDSEPIIPEALLAEECGDLHIHEHRDAIINRLARIEGHVRGVKSMVEAGRPCPEILIQIAALRSALNRAGRLILEDHLKGCMVDAVRSGDHEVAFQALEQALDQFIR